MLFTEISPFFLDILSRLQTNRATDTQTSKCCSAGPGQILPGLLAQTKPCPNIAVQLPGQNSSRSHFTALAWHRAWTNKPHQIRAGSVQGQLPIPHHIPATSATYNLLNQIWEGLPCNKPAWNKPVWSNSFETMLYYAMKHMMQQRI